MNSIYILYFIAVLTAKAVTEQCSEKKEPPSNINDPINKGLEDLFPLSGEMELIDHNWGEPLDLIASNDVSPHQTDSTASSGASEEMTLDTGGMTAVAEASKEVTGPTVGVSSPFEASEGVTMSTGGVTAIADASEGVTVSTGSVTPQYEAREDATVHAGVVTAPDEASGDATVPAGGVTPPVDASGEVTVTTDAVIAPSGGVTAPPEASWDVIAPTDISLVTWKSQMHQRFSIVLIMSSVTLALVLMAAVVFLRNLYIKKKSKKPTPSPKDYDMSANLSNVSPTDDDDLDLTVYLSPRSQAVEYHPLSSTDQRILDTSQISSTPDSRVTTFLSYRPVASDPSTEESRDQNNDSESNDSSENTYAMPPSETSASNNWLADMIAKRPQLFDTSTEDGSEEAEPDYNYNDASSDDVVNC